MDAAVRDGWNEKITVNVNLMLKAAVKNPGNRGTVVLYHCFGASKPTVPSWLCFCSLCDLNQDNYDFYVFQLLQQGNREKDIFWCLFVTTSFDLCKPRQILKSCSSTSQLRGTWGYLIRIRL